MGHGGTLATLHADSPELAFSALKTNVTLAGIAGDAADMVFRQNIDLIVQVERLPNYERVVTDLYVSQARKAKIVSQLVFNAPLVSNAELQKSLSDQGIFATDAELDEILAGLALKSPELRIKSLLYNFEGREHAMNDAQRRAVELVTLPLIPVTGRIR
jgi:hypothetical protein